MANGKNASELYGSKSHPSYHLITALYTADLYLKPIQLLSYPNNVYFNKSLYNAMGPSQICNYIKIDSLLNNLKGIPCPITLIK